MSEPLVRICNIREEARVAASQIRAVASNEPDARRAPISLGERLAFVGWHSCPFLRRGSHARRWTGASVGGIEADAPALVRFTSYRQREPDDMTNKAHRMPGARTPRVRSIESYEIGPGGANLARREAHMARARANLARLKTYEQWMATRPEQEFPIGDLRTPRELYDLIVQGFESEAVDPTPKSITLLRDGTPVRIW